MDSDDEIDLNALHDDFDEQIPVQIPFDNLLRGEGFSFESGTLEEVFTNGAAAQPVRQNTVVVDDELLEKMKISFFNEETGDTETYMTGSYEGFDNVMENVTKNGSIKKKVLRPGLGDLVKNGDVVIAHLITCVEDQDEPIMTTYTGKGARPQRFRVGNGECIPLMDIGFTTMKVGEIALFLGTPEVGYGELGISGCGIPPMSRVLVKIEIVEIIHDKTNKQILSMSTAERQSLPFDELFEHIKSLKEHGNREFKDDNIEQAKNLYELVYDCLADSRPHTKEQLEEYRDVSMKVCCNLSQTYFLLEKYKRASAYAKQAISVKNMPRKIKAKAYYHNAKALLKLGHYKDAYDNICQAEMSIYNDPFVQNLKKEIQKKRDESVKAEAKLYQKMVGVGEEESGRSAAALESAQIAHALKNIRLDL